MTHTPHFNAIELNLQMISSYLSQVQHQVDMALSDMRNDNQNAAIGALLDLPDLLDSSKGLYSAIIAMHRNSR